MAFDPAYSKSTGKPIESDWTRKQQLNAQPAPTPATVEKKRLTPDEKLARLKQIAVGQRDQIRELDSRVMELERTIANMQAREDSIALVLKNVAIHCHVDFRGIQ